MYNQYAAQENQPVDPQYSKQQPQSYYNPNDYQPQQPPTPAANGFAQPEGGGGGQPYYGGPMMYPGGQPQAGYPGGQPGQTQFMMPGATVLQEC